MKYRDVMKFARQVEKLKQIPRTGFVDRHIRNPDTVAEHSYRAAVMGMLLSDINGMDTEKIIRMLLLHDIEESVTGDIPRNIKSKMSEKQLASLRRRQVSAVKKILVCFPKGIQKRYFDLWLEMEECETKEAKFCKDIDRLELVLQLLDFERQDKGNKKKLEIFWNRHENNTPTRVDSIIKIYEGIRKDRFR
jgi:putative hydrolases of HD superfamily